MKVSAQSGNALPFLSLRQALGYDKATHVSHNSGDIDTCTVWVQIGCARTFLAKRRLGKAGF